MSNHAVKECNYPKNRDIGVGVSVVIFNKTLEKVLLVVEKHGKGKMKPVTGSIDYGVDGETPLQTAMREVLEEVGIKLQEKELIPISNYWANDLTGKPDVHFSYAVILPEEAEIIIQREELTKASWENTRAYLDSEEDKNWIMKRVVFAAYEALKNGNVLKTELSAFSSGKPVLHHRPVHQSSML